MSVCFQIEVPLILRHVGREVPKCYCVMLECPAYQEIRSEFGELFDYCEGDLRKLMCHPKQHIFAKLVHKMRVFRDEDTEWVFDLQLDRFESSEDDGMLAPGFSFSKQTNKNLRCGNRKCNIQTVREQEQPANSEPGPPDLSLSSAVFYWSGFSIYIFRPCSTQAISVGCAHSCSECEQSWCRLSRHHFDVSLADVEVLEGKQG